MAPSHYNAQPWSIGVSRETVEVWAEPSRRAPVADPDGRQLLIGGGAALFAVRLEVAGLGLSTARQLLPGPDRPRPAALVPSTGTHAGRAARAVAAGTPPADGPGAHAGRGRP